MSRTETDRVITIDRRPVLWLLDTDDQLAEDFALAAPGWEVRSYRSIGDIALEIGRPAMDWPALVIFDLQLDDAAGTPTEQAALGALRLLDKAGYRGPRVGYVTHLRSGVSSVEGVDCRLYSKLDVGPRGVMGVVVGGRAR